VCSTHIVFIFAIYLIFHLLFDFLSAFGVELLGYESQLDSHSLILLNLFAGPAHKLINTSRSISNAWSGAYFAGSQSGLCFGKLA